MLHRTWLVYRPPQKGAVYGELFIYDEKGSLLGSTLKADPIAAQLFALAANRPSLSCRELSVVPRGTLDSEWATQTGGNVRDVRVNWYTRSECRFLCPATGCVLYVGVPDPSRSLWLALREWQGSGHQLIAVPVRNAVVPQSLSDRPELAALIRRKGRHNVSDDQAAGPAVSVDESSPGSNQLPEPAAAPAPS